MFCYAKLIWWHYYFSLKKFRFIFKNSEKCVTCQNKVHRYDLQKYIEAVSTSKAYTTNVTKQNDLDDLHDKLENAEAKIKLLQLQLRNKEKLCESLRRTQVVKKEAALTKKEALAEENTALTVSNLYYCISLNNWQEDQCLKKDVCVLSVFFCFVFFNLLCWFWYVECC